MHKYSYNARLLGWNKIDIICTDKAMVHSNDGNNVDMICTDKLIKHYNGCTDI